MLMYTDCIGIPPELSESAIVLAKAIIIISIVTPGFLHTVEGVVQSNGSLARTYLLAGINLAAMWLVDRLTHRSYIHHDAGGYLLYRGGPSNYQHVWHADVCFLFITVRSGWT